MEVHFKKLTVGAKTPTKAHPSDAGYDLTATSLTYDLYGNAVYGTGIAVELPPGYVGLVFPRSSIADIDLALTNAVGVIDSGYRGEIKAKFKPALRFTADYDYGQDCCVPSQPVSIYKPGDRIAQLVIMRLPWVEFKEVKSLAPSDRGAGGYGSTGK